MLVALAGPAAAPRVVLRRRITLSQHTPRQPFHAAEGKPFAKAERLIQAAIQEATALADRALQEAVTELSSVGYEPLGAGLLVAAGRTLPGLREVLASHALIHAAEGELFRDVLRQASARCGLRAVEVRERDLEELSARALHRSTSDIKSLLAGWGKVLGPPWTQDEKRAALAAWLALEARKNDA